MIASPSVVGGHLTEHNLLAYLLGQLLCKERLYLFGLWCYNQKYLARGNLHGHLDVAMCYFLQNGSPVGSGMRPSQLNGTLRIPFGRQMGRSDFCQFRAMLLIISE